ncbi:MAG TPA: hypothetical protein VLX58_14375 [Bryobacteraceae bacterium]|nr:hypothetical protein [Bryobacteraceae bacterium]
MAEMKQQADETKARNDLTEYAGGWITERKGTEVPGFLKLAIVVITGGALAYFFLYMYGETRNEERGALVQQLNAATQSSVAFMYLIAAMIILFAVIVAVFALRKSQHQ